ncbi:MAG TPA: adenylate kinase [Kineosporiaceae bacterium]|nr:adenylate kinase [Kineosporiaceae bacterium]
MRLVLLGPPGAGKGTQAKRLAEWLKVPAISTGDIFRANIAGNTALGQLARSFTDVGKLVPDEVTNEMVKDRLAQADTANGFLLDGYPRNVAQVAALDGMLTEAGTVLDAVVEITADTDEVVGRLLKRAEIEGRPDDTEDVIRHRLEVYGEQTAPLTDVYGARRLLVQVDGVGEIDEVTGRLTQALSALQG